MRPTNLRNVRMQDLTVQDPTGVLMPQATKGADRQPLPELAMAFLEAGCCRAPALVELIALKIAN